MFIFGLYTVIVWWLAFGWRRRWLGALSVTMGTLGMFGIKGLLALLPEPSPLMDVLIIPYAALLFIGGVYIVALPRPRRILACKSCLYDMKGHEEEGARCPECGLDDAAFVPRRRLPARRPVRHAQREHAEGQPPEQGPGEPAPASL